MEGVTYALYMQSRSSISKSTKDNTPAHSKCKYRTISRVMIQAACTLQKRKNQKQRYWKDTLTFYKSNKGVPSKSTKRKTHQHSKYKYIKVSRFTIRAACTLHKREGESSGTTGTRIREVFEGDTYGLHIQ